MIKPILILAVITAVSLGGAARSQQTDGSPNAGATGLVRGNVVIGPICPGPAQIGRPECVKRPIQTTVRVFVAPAPGSGNGETSPLTTVATDPGGQFRIALPPGTYRLVPVSPPGISRGKPTDVAVTAGSTADVELLIDTGLR